ncbi:MAG: MFS transporter [Candidatus Bathyarchaeia archaeon]
MFSDRVNVDIKILLALFFGYFSFSMFRLSLGVAIPNIILEMKINEFQAGVLYSIPLWSTALLLTPAGWLADRFGRKKLLSLGYFFLAIGVLFFGCSLHYSLSAISLIISGLGSGMLIPSYYSLMGDMLKRIRGLGVGLAVTSYQIGGLVGSYLVGSLAAANKWRTAFIIMGVLQLFMLMIQLIIVPSSSSKSSKGTQKPFFDMLKIRNVVVSSIGMLTGSIGLFAANAWLPSFLILRGCNQADSGLILGLYFIAGALSSPVLGGLSERIGRKKATFYSSIIAAVIAAIIFLTNPSLVILIAGLIILGIFIAPYWSLLTTIAQESVPEENASAATGVVQTLGLWGCAIGPVISGALIPIFGINYALLSSITLPCTLCALITLLLNHY